MIRSALVAFAWLAFIAASAAWAGGWGQHRQLYAVCICAVGLTAFVPDWPKKKRTDPSGA